MFSLVKFVYVYAIKPVTLDATVRGVVSLSAAPKVIANEMPTEKSIPTKAGNVKFEFDTAGIPTVIKGTSVPTVGALALLYAI